MSKDISLKGDTQMVNQNMKMCLRSLIFREMENGTKMRYHLKKINIAAI